MFQGLYTSDLDDSLESSWEWMLKFKDKVYSIAFQVSNNLWMLKLNFFAMCDSRWQPVHKPGSDGIKLSALKFVQAIILLYSPDPNGSLEPPSDQRLEGKMNVRFIVIAATVFCDFY